MFSWTLTLPEETKISDAYQMLKKQGELSAVVINWACAIRRAAYSRLNVWSKRPVRQMGWQKSASVLDGKKCVEAHFSKKYLNECACVYAFMCTCNITKWEQRLAEVCSKWLETHFPFQALWSRTLHFLMTDPSHYQQPDPRTPSLRMRRSQR